MRRLCIVGGGVTKDKAPFNDPEAIIWSTASVGLGLPRCDAIFEIHDNAFKPEDLNKSSAIIYMKDKREDVPNSERFPIDLLEAAYGKRFNGTVVMMLAYAGLRNYENIELYGVDFSSDDEYARRNMFYWMMGYLSAQGYKIEICPGGYLKDTCATYAYEVEDNQFIADIKKRMSEQVEEDEKIMDGLVKRKWYVKGVFDTLDKVGRRY